MNGLFTTSVATIVISKRLTDAMVGEQKANLPLDATVYTVR